ncbi:MAG TPA: hypothetical protein VIY66_08080 [Candidatus Acidoferrales bacterium]
MKRSLYRVLVLLHPQRFRERFGEEMLCIFDESPPERGARLLVDCLLSLLRQWLLRSGVWKLAGGAAISVLLLCGWAYSLTSSVNAWQTRALETQAAFTKHVSPLDKVLFSRYAAQAVAFLAESRRAEAEKQRSERRRIRRTPVDAPEDTRTNKISP